MTANQARKRVLITGAAGRIGSIAGRAVARTATTCACTTTARSPSSRRWPTISSPTSPTTTQIAPALDGMDAVVHMAGEPSPRASWEEVHEANIVGTYNVFEAAAPGGRAQDRLRLDQSRHGHVRPRRAVADLQQSAAPARFALRRLEGVRRTARPPLRRPARPLGDLPADRLVPARAARRDRALDVAQPARLRPGRLARDREPTSGSASSTPSPANGGRHWDITDTIEKLGYRPEDDAERYIAEHGL